MKLELMPLDALDQVVPLFDSYRQFYHQPADPANARTFLRERLIRQEAMIIVAGQEEKLYGFALIYPLFSSVRMKPIYLLNDLFVIPEARNKNVGKDLLRFCQQLARENNQAGIQLETDKTNAVGNYLYPLTGFELIQHANFYFWENK
ncbi:MAG: GNAT family N-acetyltransferase [Saprospiraceae bacterium]|nr:GNAT family N-acetyltransferase [Saprospiraceae bacterium]